MSSYRVRRPQLLLAVGVAAVALLAVGCSDDEAGTATSTTTATTASTTSAPTTAVPDVEVDQTPPQGANGLKVAPDGTLWIASLSSDVVLQVDPADGRILRRIATPAGSGPDDVAFDAEGVLYWTGFLNGDVGRIEPGSDETTVIANVGPGANPIAVLDDGTLLVGRAGTATGLHAVDPDGGTAAALGDPGNVNSFDVGDDGQLYAPHLIEASVVAVDPSTGTTTRTVAELDGTPIALRWHEGTLYVLMLADQARVVRVDPSTGAVEPFGETGLSIADNLAVADDGTVYVTGLETATVTVFGADGTRERTVDIGS